ncbi:hypothetical protein [Bacillus suaedae]|uniref:Uncharacterized protein n=1 Tax=Halalkalibacter suaedae TaxID=2822140 RepID=A0A940X155_9BACI|nr:hypothetical protein [Bacillus suaedae]MBP3953661.1 hypothetical protein [Bacillus suaedae]
MEHLIVCIIIWTLTFIIVPLKRIFELKRIIFISIILMTFLDNISFYLGYYSYEQILFPIGKASFFHLLVCAGVGILMVNWLTKESITKLISILTVANVFSLLLYFYNHYGAFRFGSFTYSFTFIYFIAALSTFIWLVLIFVDENTIYEGKKTREIINHS